ncbi:hypothetical protein FJV80_31940 [Mesorhizobium sp. WSM4310]|nr:hypothetical protein FJV80_31940 [Mesorhizobium sp. WSM4310]
MAGVEGRSDVAASSDFKTSRLWDCSAPSAPKRPHRQDRRGIDRRSAIAREAIPKATGAACEKFHRSGAGCRRWRVSAACLGLTLAAVTSRLIGDLVAGRDDAGRLAPFAADRF